MAFLPLVACTLRVQARISENTALAERAGYLNNQHVKELRRRSAKREPRRLLEQLYTTGLASSSPRQPEFRKILDARALGMIALGGLPRSPGQRFRRTLPWDEPVFGTTTGAEQLRYRCG